MTKWADFVVSAIKKGSGLSNITHVQIHEDLEHGLTAPTLINKNELSSKIQKGVSFITIFKKNENEWVAGDYGLERMSKMAVCLFVLTIIK